MRAAHLALGLVVSVVLLAACGGRFAKTEGDDDGTGASASGQGASTSSGARPGRAGNAGTGASTAQGGASTGTAGGIAVGGAVSTAGTATTGGSCGNCPMLACPAGTQAVPSPNGCCFICQPVAVCPDIPCPPLACASGSHLEVLPGQCCPTCVADVCEDQRIAYIRMREQLLDKYRTLGCMTHQDCSVYFEKNACEIGCGIVVPSAAFQFLDQNLPSFAAQTCSPDCPPLPLPCEPPAQPFCVNGLCQ
jgi:hypothetical protein